MKRNVCAATVFGLVLLAGAFEGHAEEWVKMEFDIPNQNLEANYYDTKSVKGHNKTISWTEKYALTSFGEKKYSKHLSQYPACRKSIEKDGNVTYHKMDFEIKEGKFRVVARRNYNKANGLVCTDKDMGKELDKSWKEIAPKSPMMEREYLFVSKYKLGNI
ncbi:MAG: hypothetical protein PHY09_16575 [Desulfuromonadaceae bacterium]|nr:hypothetical protein [Desulfuromonadaceae bacterium]MDD5106925.1 hypothetical protein [Desulfuromonadaceae bacterium]